METLKKKDNFEELLRELFPHISKNIRNKNIKFHTALQDFTENPCTILLDAFLDEKGYKREGVKIITKDYAEVLNKEEQFQIKKGDFCIGKLDFEGREYFVLASDKDNIVGNLVELMQDSTIGVIKQGRAV